MLHRVRMDDESSPSDAASTVSGDGSSAMSLGHEMVDRSSGSSMSMVFRSSQDEGRRSQSNSRPGSPARKSSAPSSVLHGRRASQGASGHERNKNKREQEDHLCRWLQAGNVIYKSVGLGLMDLTVGMKMIELAKQKQIGTCITGF